MGAIGSTGFRRLAICLAAVAAVIAIVAVVWGLPGTDDAAKRRRVERAVGNVRCPGEPPRPTACRKREDDLYDCETEGHTQRVDPDHLEFSIIC
jgi:hypothetical protein